MAGAQDGRLLKARRTPRTRITTSMTTTKSCSGIPPGSQQPPEFLDRYEADDDAYEARSVRPINEPRGVRTIRPDSRPIAPRRQ